MTDKEKLLAIKSEIERLSNFANGYYTDRIASGYKICCSDITSFIDSLLQEESVSEELEEASRNYADDEEYGDDVYFAIKAAFKAGAKWQEKQDQSTIELAEDHAMLAGMEKMKEQMMAKGVDGVVHHIGKCGVASVHYKDPTGVHMACFISPKGFVAGDKVKVIVIKED